MQTGVITMQQQELYISPLTDEHAEKYRRRRRDISNPHIIYRRNTDTDLVMDKDEANEHFCALDPGKFLFFFFSFSFFFFIVVVIIH